MGAAPARLQQSTGDMLGPFADVVSNGPPGGMAGGWGHTDDPKQLLTDALSLVVSRAITLRPPRKLSHCTGGSGPSAAPCHKLLLWGSKPCGWDLPWRFMP